MGFSEDQIALYRQFLSVPKKTVVLFDDDCDGTTSYAMLFHALKKAGFDDIKGFPVKRSPEVTDFYLGKLRGAELVFILDKPRVSQSFIDGCNPIPIVWLDHHEPQSFEGAHVHYFNPRVADDNDNRPTSYWAYKFVGSMEDSWIAAVGSVGDWHLTDALDDCKKQYPFLLPKSWDSVGSLYFDSPLSPLVKLMNYLHKGELAVTLRLIRKLLVVESPQEILSRTTTPGRALWTHFSRYEEGYKQIKEAALATAQDTDGFFVYLYSDIMSYTSELSNELLHRFPDRVILVGRKHNGDIKGSIRSSRSGPEVHAPLQKVFESVSGGGGGHKHACGFKIHEADWDIFFDLFKKELA